MAGRPRSIFNEKAAEKLRSPDDLDRYLRVTNPRAWAVLAACAALLAGLLAWGVFGAVSTSQSATAVVVDGRAICFLTADQVAKVHEGDAASVDGERTKVTSVASVPLSREEGRAVLGSDYLVASLFEDDWAYPVEFEDAGGGDLAAGVPLAVSITTERIAPISLILGGE